MRDLSERSSFPAFLTPVFSLHLLSNVPSPPVFEMSTLFPESCAEKSVEVAVSQLFPRGFAKEYLGLAVRVRCSSKSGVE